MPEAAAPTVLVTGATDGIGRATALALAARGATVLVHGRDPARAAAVAREANAVPGAPGDAESVVGDLASLAAVRALAAAVRARGAPLDVLVNNAGVAFRDAERRLSADGFELTFAVNHLAHFLLTRELLDLLAEAAARRGGARVVTVSSELHARGRIDFDDLQGERRYGGTAAYANSKLANVLFARGLARRTAARGVTSNALHPGVIRTKLLRDGFGSNGGATVERGAATSVHLALHPAVAAVTGAYFVDSRETPPAAAALDDAVGSGCGK
jgi:NAD(P)-dependent dehydrogenase (short-subunit alcohol dehydrogenase family)